MIPGLIVAVVASSLVVDDALFQQHKENGGAPVRALIMLPPLNYTAQRQPSDDDVAELVKLLREHARVTQAPITALLTAHGCDEKITSLWVTNALTAVISSQCIEALQGAGSNSLAGFEGSIKVVSDEPWQVKLEEPEPYQMMGDRGQMYNGSRVDKHSGPEWNVKWIKSTFLWDKGFKGKGMVHANADTGIEYTHPALRLLYRGSNRKDHELNSDVDHNHNWFDATQFYDVPAGDISVCEQGVRYPCDDHGHGTHCTGTTVGDGGPGNEIGIAPDSVWIGCRNMYNGLGSPGSYLGCLQFFVAPTDLDGKNHDVSLRPHTIGNSYGCPAKEGCNPYTFREALGVVRAAGIFMAVSAGNDGRGGCSTVGSAPGLDLDVCSVGAGSFESDKIADYSSRGPVTADGSGRRKPDITAPGSDVKSAWVGDTYRSISGTSMAAPAVAGGVLLLWEAFPEIKRDLDATEKLIYDSATALYDTTEGCGGDDANTLPNEVYGFGMMNLQTAYNMMSTAS
jgi:subtilisin family serine protease